MENQVLRCAFVFGLVLSGCGRAEPELPESAPRVCAGGTPSTPTLGFVTPWAPGCIDVEYVDELAHELPLFRSALAAWSGPDCTAVCFNTPQPFSGRPNIRRILLHQDNGSLRSTDGVIGVSFGGVPGHSRVRNDAAIVRRRETRANAEDYLGAVGSALGFLAVTGVDSSLSSSRSSLSEDDVQSVCAVYPCN